MRALAMTLLLTGCGTWERPDTSPEQSKADQRDCAEITIRALPPDIRQTRAGHQEPDRTHCEARSGKMECRTIRGRRVEAVYEDRNERAREIANVQCMEQKGYRHVAREHPEAAR